MVIAVDALMTVVEVQRVDAVEELELDAAPRNA